MYRSMSPVALQETADRIRRLVALFKRGPLKKYSESFDIAQHVDDARLRHSRLIRSSTTSWEARACSRSTKKLGTQAGKGWGPLSRPIRGRESPHSERYLDHRCQSTSGRSRTSVDWRFQGWFGLRAASRKTRHMPTSLTQSEFSFPIVMRAVNHTRSLASTVINKERKTIVTVSGIGAG